MKITLFRIMVTVGLFWGGGQGLYTALLNREPLDISVSDYLKDRPDTKWLHLTEGTLDIFEMSYTSSKLTKIIKEVFIPVQPSKASATSAAPVRILVASKDSELIAFATQMRDAKTEIEALKILASKRSLIQERPITGLVQFGIDLTDKETKRLHEMNENLTNDFIILNDGEKPSFGLSIAMFAGGLVMLFLFLIGFAGGKKADQPPSLVAR